MQNNLFSDNFNHLTKLLLPGNAKVPTEETTNKPAILKQFCNRTGCSHEEAKYYLEDTNYNFEEAYKEWQEDEKWSKNPQSNNRVQSIRN